MIAHSKHDSSGLISLFCGPGGLDEGFRQANFKTLLAYDIDMASVRTFQHNHPNAVVIREDLSSVNADKIVRAWNQGMHGKPIGIIGGPPCQSFSIGNSFQSEDDPRHKLPEHYARLLRKLNSVFEVGFFVFENVPGLITKKHIKKFSRFKALFEDAGFRVFEGSLDAQDFGVAQVRKRIFVVGVNRILFPDINFRFPEPTTVMAKTVEKELEGLPEPRHFERGLKPEDLPHHPNHWCMVPRSAKFSNGTLKPGEIVGRSFRVLPWNAPSYTVAYGHREVHIHPSCKRRLSVYEVMRLQGFPDEYQLLGTLSDQIRLVSEAVSPPVARALAEAINTQLYGEPMNGFRPTQH